MGRKINFVITAAFAGQEVEFMTWLQAYYYLIAIPKFLIWR